MYAEKAVPLGGDRGTVMVREMVLGEVRNAVVQLGDGFADFKLADFVVKLPEFLPLLNKSIELPSGKTADDLTLSEVWEVIEAFKEMNPTFFGVMAGMLPGLYTLAGKLRVSEPLPTSTAPSAPSSTPDTTVASGTDGASFSELSTT